MSHCGLAEAARLAREGRTASSIQLLQQQVAATGLSYPLCSNLAALHLQLGDLPEAISLCAKAVALDPYCHTAYFNRFLCFLTSLTREAARKELHKALSCLYCLQGFLEGNSKKLNKAISYCQQNAKAYLWRAKLNQGKNNKLAENDFSAAIQYDPNLADVYQQRALFFRSLGRMQQFEQDCSQYLRLKREKNPSVTELTDNETLVSQTTEAKIKEEVKEFEDLLLQVGRLSVAPSVDLRQSTQLEGMSKLPLSSIQSQLNRKEDQQLLLSDRNEAPSAQTISINKEEIQFKKKAEKEKNFREIFEDQSSTELDKKIISLEKEIQREGGKLTAEQQVQQELDVSDPNNFLTQEIEKAINQITKLSNLEVSDVKSARSARSGGSRISEPKELSLEDFNSFNSISIEVVSLEDINTHNKKETSKVLLKYGQRVCETSMAKYYWREKFTFGLMNGITELDVTVIEKGGIFRGDLKVGEGTINLLDSHNVKCILGNQDKKVAILYFEIELR